MTQAEINRAIKPRNPNKYEEESMDIFVEGIRACHNNMSKLLIVDEEGVKQETPPFDTNILTHAGVDLAEVAEFGRDMVLTLIKIPNTTGRMIDGKPAPDSIRITEVRLLYDEEEVKEDETTKKEEEVTEE